MYDEFSTTQLIELRLLYAEMLEKGADIAARAEALQVLEYFDEELAKRQQKIAA